MGTTFVLKFIVYDRNPYTNRKLIEVSKYYEDTIQTWTQCGKKKKNSLHVRVRDSYRNLDILPPPKTFLRSAPLLYIRYKHQSADEQGASYKYVQNKYTIKDLSRTETLSKTCFI